MNLFLICQFPNTLSFTRNILTFRNLSYPNVPVYGCDNNNEYFRFKICTILSSILVFKTR